MNISLDIKLSKKLGVYNYKIPELSAERRMSAWHQIVFENSFCRESRVAIVEKQPRTQLLFHHDNAPAHSRDKLDLKKKLITKPFF